MSPSIPLGRTSGFSTVRGIDQSNFSNRLPAVTREVETVGKRVAELVIHIVVLLENGGSARPGGVAWWERVVLFVPVQPLRLCSGVEEGAPSHNHPRARRFGNRLRGSCGVVLLSGRRLRLARSAGKRQTEGGEKGCKFARAHGTPRVPERVSCF